MILQSNYFLVILSAILVGISQQPLGLGFLSWIGLIPFLNVIINQKTYRSIFKFSFLWGIIYHLVVVFWLATNIGTTPFIAFISMVATVLILSINTILICLLWFKIKSTYPQYSLLLFSVLWVTVEYVRSYGLLGFPWISLANSQTDFIYLIQNAEFVGIYGITFWILLVNIFLFDIKKHYSNKKIFCVYLAIILLPWLIGYKIYPNNIDKGLDKDGLSVLLVQPNINLFDKRNISIKNKNLDNIIKKTHEKILPNNDLIIWPESAIPYHRVQNPLDRNYLLQKLFKYDKQYLLTGNIIYENPNVYNSAVLLDKNGINSMYHKRQLVPLAEHFPFSENFEYLKNINIGQTNFSKGKADHVFDIKGYQIASLICFESTFPEINRRHANMDLDAIVYLVNDGWYTTPPQPQQHAKQAIYRAIENRMPVIRCANTGISMLINRAGEIENIIDLNKTGTMNISINKNNYEKTFYTRFGNVFSLILLIITLILLCKSIFKNEKK